MGGIFGGLRHSFCVTLSRNFQIVIKDIVPMQYRGDKIGRKFCGVTVVLDNLKIIGDLTHSVLARCVRIWWKKQDGGVGQGQDISWAWNLFQAQLISFIKETNRIWKTVVGG